MNSRRAATIKDVSLAAGVSCSTVSRYINQSGYVSDKVAAQIQRAIDELAYHPNQMAKGLKAGGSKQIMHIVPDISNPYYSAMYKQIQRVAHENGYTVQLFDSGDKQANEVQALESCLGNGVSGLVYCSTQRHDEVLKLLGSLPVPVVVNNRYEGLELDTIHSEDGLGMYTAVEYLVGLGHKNIAYVGGPHGSYINKKRYKGYLRCLQEHELPANPDFVFEMDFSMDAGYKAGNYFAGLAGLPTAICAANDIIALGILMAFHERGIDVPGDVSLTGEDNIDFAKLSRPSLTTIDNDSAFFAEKACEMLFQRINREYGGGARIHKAPRHIVERQSTRRLV